MSILRVLLLGLLAIVLLVLALANRGIVTLRMMPETLADGLGLPTMALNLPIFVVVLAAFGLGLAFGYILEWLREYRYRRAAARERAQREKLERKLARAEGQHDDGDDVLAIVDGREPARA